MEELLKLFCNHYKIQYVYDCGLDCYTFKRIYDENGLTKCISFSFSVRVFQTNKIKDIDLIIEVIKDKLNLEV